MALNDQERAQAAVIVVNGTDAARACIRADLPDEIAVGILSDGILGVADELGVTGLARDTVEKVAYSLGLAMVQLAHAAVKLEMVDD